MELYKLFCNKCKVLLHIISKVTCNFVLLSIKLAKP